MKPYYMSVTLYSIKVKLGRPGNTPDIYYKNYDSKNINLMLESTILLSFYLVSKLIEPKTTTNRLIVQ